MQICNKKIIVYFLLVGILNSPALTCFKNAFSCSWSLFDKAGAEDVGFGAGFGAGLGARAWASS